MISRKNFSYPQTTTIVLRSPPLYANAPKELPKDYGKKIDETTDEFHERLLAMSNIDSLKLSVDDLMLRLKLRKEREEAEWIRKEQERKRREDERKKEEAEEEEEGDRGGSEWKQQGWWREEG
ncbi:hypothetical protein B0H13DRAFT_2351982 [Mycena leptocephala]|nr:hypothetical protein B0H13DRAFT_2351982 [Mycena leptocephala]